MSQPTHSSARHPSSPALRGASRLLALSLIGAIPRFAPAQALDTYIGSKGGMHSKDAPITDTDSSGDPYTPFNTVVGAAFGRVSSSLALAAYPHPGGDIGPTTTSNNFSAHCGELIDVPSIDPSYTVRLTMHYDGGRPSATPDDGAGAGRSAIGVTVGSVSYSDDTYDVTTFIPIPRTFTVDFPAGYDNISFNYTISGFAAGGCPDEAHGGHPAFGSAAGALTRGSFVILDGNGNAVDFAAETRSGNIRTLSYPAGGSFDSFSVTNNPAVAVGSFGSTMHLLGGQASAPTQVVAAFVPPPADNSIKPVSDVVDLTGTNSDPVVVKIDFDAAAAHTYLGSLAYLQLAFYHAPSGKWKNAVLGNTGITQPTFLNRGYNPATDFHLGYFGVDTVNNYAWAVVNHNTPFVVTAPTPELAVSSITRPSAGSIRLNCKGEPARGNRIEFSANLQNWSTLATVTAAGDGTFQYDDAAASGPKRFYRVAYP